VNLGDQLPDSGAAVIEFRGCRGVLMMED